MCSFFMQDWIFIRCFEIPNISFEILLYMYDIRTILSVGFLILVYVVELDML